MSLKGLSRLAVLAALCVVLRYLFAPLPNVQPLTAIFLVLAVSSSLGQALGVMVVSILVSSFLLLFGPWVFWQIFSFTTIISCWRLLIYPLLRERVFLQALAAASLAFLYGVIIDGIMALFYGTNPLVYIAAGTVFNLAHAASTLVFYPIIISLFRRFKHEKII